MHLEILVEEPSAATALEHLLPRLLGNEVSWALHAFQGKRDLLKKLPARLRAYRRWLPADWRILVLVDADEGDCRLLKGKLEQEMARAGIETRAAAAGAGFQALNRIAVQELEAWFLGDPTALRLAFPNLSPRIADRAGLRDPDAVSGTWERLELELQRAGYYGAGMPKIEVAERVARQMDLARNRSRSFRVFVEGVKAIVGPGSTSPQG